ncbi:hypothetical protein Gohar_014204 [Gossypium harknessii]|uniref:Legume lectin domain-containing protein n=1 Tax=Gossypium harknessii TaxID=34285 RepID=A0A7J9H2Q0_9ROSI|nr:hypothetical protein [Gossypium harknessii]
MSWLIMLVLLFLLNLVSSDINQGQFSFDSYLNVDGVAGIDSSGLFKLTNFTRQTEGHIFYKNPIQFKNSTNGSVFSFPTTSIFAIVSEYPTLFGHGLAFVVSPNNGIPGALPSQYLGLFNQSNNGNNSNHIVAVELDIIMSSEFNDINDNHVGIDINGLNSMVSAPIRYFTDEGKFINVSLIREDPLQIWVEYNGMKK